MFEKSLYDLIRGLRNHKGNEREYIQNSLRECRTEIRGADMDLKTTALLKLIYLEMFGHDMSWAAFNVLEVMSSSKYLQKRVGYLGAVQSFRPDTEVLMLATNLLKKDINSVSIPTISLPLITLPHVITPSLSMSLLSDLMPRLSHSSASIRKKTVVALYRLALAYPETLRPAWPKIKDMLMTEEEDPSVTAAVINVVCELGWRRPRDFLPLAPRLFDLLVDGGNNWMTIKIIKLFATLTPLEPRLIKKLLPPLMTLIQTTPAMSLLYECINGIIQGGILEGTDGAHEGEEVAAVCVAKLRGMIASEGDPNLRYVALLAFNKIVISHPQVVAKHQDIIMSCIDDPDVSIRLQALDLGSGMINTENLVSVVNRLMQQLRDAPYQGVQPSINFKDRRSSGPEPAADSDGEDPEETLHADRSGIDENLPMLDEYRITIIRHILGMCSRDMYSYIADFEWYINVLVDLVRLVPVSSTTADVEAVMLGSDLGNGQISGAIGSELRNVAVRVVAVRTEAVRAADSLIATQNARNTTLALGFGGQGVLQYAAWVVGEYAGYLANKHDTLNSLLLSLLPTLRVGVICAYLQAMPKVLVQIFISYENSWSLQTKTMTSLLLARVIHLLEPCTTHPSLEVQERSVEFLELMRVAVEAVNGHEQSNDAGPLLLSRAIPSLFNGFELNPVAVAAQSKVPIPANLDLETPLNSALSSLLLRVDQIAPSDAEHSDASHFYSQRPVRDSGIEPAVNKLAGNVDNSFSYQYEDPTSPNPLALTRKRAERREKNRDDPFYIASEEMSSGAATPLHEIIQKSNGPDVDIDSIPIMDLELGEQHGGVGSLSIEQTVKKHKQRPKMHIMSDENISDDVLASHRDAPHSNSSLRGNARNPKGKLKKSLLEVDSSGLGEFGVDEYGDPSIVEQPRFLRKDLEETEMAKALVEVEKLRLEMQRAAERIQIAEDVPLDGTLIKKKKKKKKKLLITAEREENDREGEAQNLNSGTNSDPNVSVRKKKRKKKEKKVVAGDDNKPEVY